MSEIAQLLEAREASDSTTDTSPIGGIDTSAPRSRRAFLAGAVASVASVASVAAAPPALQAQGRRPARARQAPEAKGEVSPYSPAALAEALAPPGEWTNPIIRLVRRATLGLTDVDVANAKAVGYQTWLQSQLDYTRIDNSAVEAQVAALWPNLSGAVETLFQVDQNVLQNSLQAQVVYRAALSPRQLYERMVEFWTDHLNIEWGKVSYLKIVDDREVIRKHALGKFSDLIKASTKSPAMLAYLDQTVSRAGATNQNYARELLELHTLGVDNGYNENDVENLARVLTGWTIQGRGNFVFNAAIHDWGAKTVMGVNIPAGSPSLGQAGMQEGEQIIDMLINHPNTARYISTKLLHWFLTPEPTATQISAIASVFRATKGDIKLVVRAILNSGWMATAPVKLKRPFHFLVSSLRGSKATITNTAIMNGQMNTLGQPLYFWETPDGYPDLFEYWSGNLMPRWQFGSTLGNLRTGTIIIDSAPYLAGTTDAAIDLITTRFFGGELDVATRTGLLNYLRGGTFNDTRVRETISLAIASEAFQWY